MTWRQAITLLGTLALLVWRTGERKVGRTSDVQPRDGGLSEETVKLDLIGHRLSARLDRVGGLESPSREFAILFR